MCDKPNSGAENVPPAHPETLKLDQRIWPPVGGWRRLWYKTITFVRSYGSELTVLFTGITAAAAVFWPLFR